MLITPYKHEITLDMMQELVTICKSNDIRLNASGALNKIGVDIYKQTAVINNQQLIRKIWMQLTAPFKEKEALSP